MNYGQWPAEHVLIPWTEDREFLKIYNKIGGITNTPLIRVYTLYAVVRHTLTVPGDAAECGVYKGGTAGIIASLTRGRKKLYLFDTFSGIPPGDPTKDNRYISGGEFSDTSVEEVSKIISSIGADVELRPGIIPKTFAGLEDKFFSFVHIDLDIYIAMKDALSFFYPRMFLGGVILCDDYGSEECSGAYLAIEEYCRSIGRPPIPMATGQAMITKST